MLIFLNVISLITNISIDLTIDSILIELYLRQLQYFEG